MGTSQRPLIGTPARVSERKKARATSELTVLKILAILNSNPPKTYWDARIGMDYETLSECQPELRRLMDSWLGASCRIGDWPLREQFLGDLNNRKIYLYADH